MGACLGGAPKDAQDIAVTREIEADKSKDKTIRKLLLLGAGGSGKSTLFKQLQNIHGGGFGDRERKGFKSQIYEQMTENMKIMIEKCEEYVEQGDQNFKLTPEGQQASEYILSTRNNNEMNDDIAKNLKILWADPAIQNIFAIRNKICVPDSTKHFLDALDRIIVPNYLPSDEDLLLVRYRTTGMAEKDFVIEGTTVKIVDVGGQKNERRKWIHFFDGVTAVIFVAALSCYDEVPFEDEDGNNMIESLDVFAEHCNSHWFENVPFILFLNKKDVFEEKIKRVPLTVCFTDYEGLQEYDDALDFIKREFDAKNKNPEERQIYSHVTCATDTNQINKVFNDIQHIVINGSLVNSGLI